MKVKINKNIPYGCGGWYEKFESGIFEVSEDTKYEDRYVVNQKQTVFLDGCLGNEPGTIYYIKKKHCQLVVEEGVSNG